MRKTFARLVILTLFMLAGNVFMASGKENVSAQSVYSVNGDTITVDAGSSGDSIGSALKYAREHYQEGKIYTVKVPAGTYRLNSTLYIYGNTTLDLTGVTLSYMRDFGNMLALDSGDVNGAKAGGYGTVANITVKGGTWNGNSASSSSLLRMAHAKNITFDGCILSGGGCAHQMEMAAIDGFTVKNCTFRDMKGNGTSEKQEALQLDIPCSAYVFKGVELDGTPMKNVNISRCTFQNVPRGLGSHSMLAGVYNENIQITDNSFQDVSEECIIALNYKNCTIKGNKIKNCGAGILFQNFKKDVKAVYSTVYDGQQKKPGKVDNNMKSTISGNEIELSGKKHPDEFVGIKIYGFDLKKDTKATGKGSSDLIPKGNYAVKNITVTNNKIKTCGHGIHLLDVSDSKISGNTIESTKAKSGKDGIFAEFASKNLTISQNTIKNASRYGIFLQHGTTAKEISDNKILGSCGKYGIGLYDGCKVTKGITGNTIEKSGSNAVFVNSKCTVREIRKNVVKNSGGFGIGLYDGCTVSNEISGNKIEKSKSHGISVSMKCYAKKISGNSIKNAGGYPVIINTSSKKTITVTGNKITVKKEQDKIHVINGVVKK